jgi:hypothetical protein
MHSAADPNQQIPGPQMSGDTPPISLDPNPVGANHDSPTEDQVQVPPLPPKSNKKIIILVAVIVLLVVSAGGAFAYMKYFQKPPTTPLETTSTPSPTPSPSPVPDGTEATADWKTYTNTKYNYSFRFPSNFQTQVSAAGANTTSAPPNADMLFVYESSSKEAYLERYIEIQPHGQAATFSQEWQRSDTTINGLPATKFENLKPDTFLIYRLAIPNSPGELELQVTKDPEKTEVANQILSTFQFTN